MDLGHEKPLPCPAQADIQAGEKAQKIKYNPARLARQQRENNARIRWLSDSEETTLRAIIQRDCPDHMPEFETGLHTGMRRGEQYGLVWKSIDFRNRVITIPKSKHGQGRHVTMNSRVAAILSTMHRTEDDSNGPGYVFALRSPRSWFEPAVKAAGLTDFTWHCLRHTFISRNGRRRHPHRDGVGRTQVDRDDDALRSPGTGTPTERRGKTGCVSINCHLYCHRAKREHR